MGTKPVSKSDLKSRYPIVLRISLIINLLVIILLFALIPKLNKQRAGADLKTDDFTVVKIPIVRPPEEMAQRPQRPSIPLEAVDDDLVEEITIEGSTDLTEYDFSWVTQAPPEEPSRQPTFIYIPHEEEPEPIGGYAAILKNAVYPPMAIEMGISGTVSVYAFIDENGNVSKCWIVQGIPNSELDEAAIDAVRKTKFKPAKQRDRNVGVYILIPIKFKLD
ncbi:MAG: energy transducer TonB [Candidatus Marinimicrobia bacterium]|nr:energy transducer TonB [Candidatus Neomarinimicrobiota bacterium]